MSTSQTFLPAPVHKYQIFEEDKKDISAKKSLIVIPPYLKREKYLPRKVEDFGDGGAFPEIHIAQYPLNMGRSDSDSDNKVIAVSVDQEGKADFQKGILTQGRNKNQHVLYKPTDLIEYQGKKEELNLAKPSDEEIQKNTDKTKAAFERLLMKKVGGIRPTDLPAGANPKNQTAPEFIKYISMYKHKLDFLFFLTKEQRIIHMVESAVDPLDAPIFKLKKLPPGQGSPPVPVMHSPPRKVTVKDMEDWKIPPCISNWKNSRGLTIPLDKRLAADGKGLQENIINDKFAFFSEGLRTAEATMREEVNQRNKIIRAQLEMQKKDKDEEYRQFALDIKKRNAELANQQKDLENETEEERKARHERDELRHERELERRREYNRKHSSRKSKVERDEDRDISERIALGEASLTGLKGAQFDGRLYNNTEGVASNFGADDEYNLYSKPFFSEKKTSIYTAKVDNSIKYAAEDEFRKLNDLGNFEGDEGHSKQIKRGGPIAFDDGFVDSVDKKSSEHKDKRRRSHSHSDSE
ncbi:hypothetical protein WA158_000774 [Blastocystis sp. Blastoise]